MLLIKTGKDHKVTGENFSVENAEADTHGNSHAPQSVPNATIADAETT